MAKVSIIVPIYNVEKYLPKCLDSLINQTFKDIEVWAISDGSPDNSVSIIKEYAKKDNRIKCIEKENGGYGSVLEYAIKNITTEYFLICDPDDWLAEDAIETLYNLAIKDDLDLVVGAKYLVYNDNEEQVYDKSMEPFCRVVPGKVYDSNIGEFAFLHVSPHSKLYRTKIAKDISFPKKVSFTDFLLYILALTNVKKAIYIDQALSYYLVDRPGNSMTDINPKIFDYHIIVFNSTVEQLNEKNNVSNLIYLRLYYQFRSICNVFKNVKNKESVLEYHDKIMNLLDLLKDKKKIMYKNMFYGNYKDKLFLKLLLNKTTRKSFFDRLVK